MIKNPDQSEINQGPEVREGVPVFQPMTNEKLQELLEDISRNTGVDFTGLPASVTKPGEDLFDYHEAQLKLVLKTGSMEAYKSLLSGYGVKSLSLDMTPRLRQIAKQEGIQLNSSFNSFAYNIGGRIMYPAIREDRVLEMAQKYAKKEEVELPTTLEQAKAFLETLAEKYLYHEAGHTVYMFLGAEAKKIWNDHIRSQPSIVEKIKQLQAEHHPNPESIPVSDEAFAEVFNTIASNGKFTGRIGDVPESLKLASKLIQDWIESRQSKNQKNERD